MLLFGGLFRDDPIPRAGNRVADVIAAPSDNDAGAARADQQPRQLLRATYRLARRLSAVTGLTPVGELAVHAVARAVGARIASLAVPDAEGRRLVIISTYGYPRALVEHLRIVPGDGVLGAVFQSGTGLRVTDVATFPGIQRRRPRYQTNSLMAVPLKAGPDVLGVVSVSDRIDGQPFTRADMSVLRALVAPAALALGRERARREAESFAHAAAIDPVSGLFNRRYFHVRIDEELQRARRHETPVALLMVDIDDFKAINDTYGHLIGDLVIAKIAEILRRSVRVFDVCTRFGGEEFAIVMPGSGPEDAARVAERIRRRIEGYRSTELGALQTTASIGIAVSSSGMSVRDLIAHADQGLYLAKRGGKNQVRMTTAPAPDEPHAGDAT
jgi:diguanylate cyclase (GGDEF)-like protein